MPLCIVRHKSVPSAWLNAWRGDTVPSWRTMRTAGVVRDADYVHVLVHVWDWPLAKMLQNWKFISAVNANKILKRSGTFWQREYGDTFMRSDEQEKTALHSLDWKSAFRWHDTSNWWRIKIVGFAIY